MPGMDGLTLCRHLKRLRPRRVTMIVTAYGAGSLAEEARDAVARQILPKPVDVSLLLLRIDECLALLSCWGR